MRHVHMEVWNINGLVEAPSYKMASPRVNQPHFPLIGPGNYVENFICMYLETWFIIQRPTSYEYFRRFYTYKQADRIPAPPGNETSRQQAWTSMDLAPLGMRMNVYGIHTTYTLSHSTYL